MAWNSSPTLNLQQINRSHSNSSISSKETDNSVRTASTIASTTSSQRRSGILGKIETGFRSVFRRFSRSRTSLTEMETQILTTMTGYNREEVLKWHEKFLNDYPNGYMTRKQFILIYKSLFPKNDAERFARHIFRAFDVDKSNTIDFHEFLIGLSITSTSNSTKIKLEWTFNVFDIDGNGLLTRRESLEVIDVIVRFYLTSQGDTQNSNTERLIYLAKKSMMKIFDNISNNPPTDNLTKSQFVEGCLKDEFISQLLAPTTSTSLTTTHDTHKSCLTNS
ncbi:unnamed protein product [Rotaria magnacalcarata]|uniref:EF-hand domain-containing protein n=1 Tax=Rotaria magnacalcarata TaxID=392030 RepID=A0A816P8C7_9BILA|nr:unnamed protein product [Rotaria magnacalcarata]CAF1585467.1 unnamed protein product [Rotaria magnacalcarata]CAF2045286.1 unnamed protein product [Rotaria magnacalcarata]CAF2075976.1 unnamed protein product [Rotaria magnacalcarata]CAF2159336.1 unnamed protein product [Rotaria magnacalcarata]